MKAVIRSLLQVAVLILGTHTTIYAGTSCLSLLQSQPRDLSSLISKSDYEIVSKGEGYVIYRPIQRALIQTFYLPPSRILFDARFAETSHVSKELNYTEETLATINGLSGKVYVIEGRHRALAASKGVIIDEENGGAGFRYLLDYDFTSRDLYFENYNNGIRNLTDIDDSEIQK